MYEPQIFGHYIKADDVNGRNTYVSLNHDGIYGIWFCEDKWMIGHYDEKGQCSGYAYHEEESQCLPQSWNWWIATNDDWIVAERGLGIRCGNPNEVFHDETGGEDVNEEEAAR